jgi:hypothetical protein
LQPKVVSLPADRASRARATPAPDWQHDLFGRSHLPVTPITRADRVRLLHQAAEALQAGGSMPDAAARWLGEGLARWLENGGDLEVVLGVRAPRGSHTTPQKLILQARPGCPRMPTERPSSAMSDTPD